MVDKTYLNEKHMKINRVLNDIGGLLYNMYGDNESYSHSEKWTDYEMALKDLKNLYHSFLNEADRLASQSKTFDEVCNKGNY
jgi:hypothetical protein